MHLKCTFWNVMYNNITILFPYISSIYIFKTKQFQYIQLKHLSGLSWNRFETCILALVEITNALKMYCGQIRFLSTQAGSRTAETPASMSASSHSLWAAGSWRGEEVVLRIFHYHGGKTDTEMKNSIQTFQVVPPDPVYCPATWHENVLLSPLQSPTLLHLYMFLYSPCPLSTLEQPSLLIR